MNKVVNKHQMTFIEGRWIIDVFHIAAEYVDSRLRGNDPRVMCKSNIEKACDHVN